MNSLRSLFPAALGSIVVSCPALHAQTWNGGGTDDLWGYSANWTGGSPVPGMETDIPFAGGTRLTPSNNYGVYDDFRSLYFASGAGPFTIAGSAIDLFGKIENNSASTQTVNLAN